MNATIYIYMAVFLILLVAGIYVQYKYYKSEDEEKPTDKDINTGLTSA